MSNQTIRLKTLINTLENIINFNVIILHYKSRIDDKFNSMGFNSKCDIPKFILESNINYFEFNIEDSSITCKLDDRFIGWINFNEMIANKNEINDHLKRERILNSDYFINIILELINTIASLNTIGLNDVPVNLVLRFSNTINKCRPRSMHIVKAMFHAPGFICENWSDEKINSNCTVNTKKKMPINHAYSYLYTFIEFLADQIAHNNKFIYKNILFDIISLLFSCDETLDEQFKINLYIMLIDKCHNTDNDEMKKVLKLFDN